MLFQVSRTSYPTRRTKGLNKSVGENRDKNKAQAYIIVQACLFSSFHNGVCLMCRQSDCCISLLNTKSQSHSIINIPRLNYSLPNFDQIKDKPNERNPWLGYRAIQQKCMKIDFNLTKLSNIFPRSKTKLRNIISTFQRQFFRMTKCLKKAPSKREAFQTSPIIIYWISP